MPLPAALKWARLMPSDSVQSSEALSFGPATTTAFAIEHRRFSQVFISLFRPLNVFEKVGELAVATVRANHRCPALIGVGVAVSNAALILHRRRTGAHRQPGQAKCRCTLFGQRNWIAFAGYRVLVHFIRQQDTNRTTRKVIRATSTRQRQKSASECLVKNGFFRAFLFRITDDFTQYRRHPYQRANTLFRKLFSGFFFRLQQQYRTRIEVGKIAKKVFQQCCLHQLGTAHYSDDMNPGLRRGKHRSAGNFYRRCFPVSRSAPSLFCQLTIVICPLRHTDTRRGCPAFADA